MFYLKLKLNLKVNDVSWIPGNQDVSVYGSKHINILYTGWLQ